MNYLHNYIEPHFSQATTALPLGKPTMKKHHRPFLLNVDK